MRDVKSRVATASLVALLLAALGGCSSDQAPTSAAPVTVTVTAQPASQAPPEAVPSGDATSEPVSPAPTSGGAVPPPGQVSFKTFYPIPEGWTEGTYPVGDRAAQFGVRTDLAGPCYSDTGEKELEIRPAYQRQRLTFTVGQATDSKSSQHTMTVRVYADNEPVSVGKVLPGRTQPFDIDLAKVYAVRIRFGVDRPADGKDCAGSGIVSPVLYDGVLQ